IAGAKDSTELAQLWSEGHSQWLLGSAAILLAAFLFYRQRSHLSWYYGQIALAQVRKNTDEESVSSWLTDADSWETWLYYREGFVSLLFGFFQFAVAVIQQEFEMIFCHAFTFWLPAIGCIGACVLQRHVLTKFRYDEDPWVTWWKKQEPAK